MTYRFIHIADVHLGRHEHSSPERYADYFAALASVAAHVLRAEADALLIAGDLFDLPEPSAETLRRAMTALRPLREAGVDVIAIEGNHDRRKRGERTGALDLLESEGYLKLLRPVHDGQALVLQPYEAEEGGALYRPRDGVAVAGLGFIPHNIEEQYVQAAAQLPADAAVIVLAHVMAVRDADALEYGCVAMEDLTVLGERTAYLALGHRHTRLGMEGETDGWVFNPGSLEFVNSLDYHQPADLRGFLEVEIGDAGAGETPAATADTETANAAGAAAMPEVRFTVTDGVLESRRGAYRLRVHHVPTDKRPAHTLRVDITGCARAEQVVDAVLRTAEAEIDAALRARGPILVVRLQGAPVLSRLRMPRAAIAEALRDVCGALHVEVLDRDLLGAASDASLLVDEGGLEQVADRARGIAADLLQARGIAPGREAELSAVLLDLKAQLQGSAKNPSEHVLERMRDALRPYVDLEEDAAVADDSDAEDDIDAADDREAGEDVA